jgi:hypothetical protein
MALQSAYYDTCIFLECSNLTHRECKACQALLNVEQISWTVSFCTELSAGESSAGELIDRFEVACASYGVTVIVVRLADANRLTRRHVALRQRLLKQGLTTRDWRHLMAAVVSNSRTFCSTDADFWDPANKRNPNATRPSHAVRKQIEAGLPIAIRLPSEVV